MRTTIKTGIASSLIVEPKGAGVAITLMAIKNPIAMVRLTPDMVGALLFALEQAAEAADIEQARATAE